MKKAVNLFYCLILLLNFSESFRLLLYFFSINSIILSILTLLINILFTWSNYTSFRLIWKDVFFKKWCLLIFFLPLLLVLKAFYSEYMSLSDVAYWVSFIFLFFSLFFASATLVIAVNWQWMTYIFYACIVITVLGFIINYVNPSLIQKMGELSGSNLASVTFGSEEERALGFFPHPNVAGFSIICYFLLLFTTPREKPKKVSFYIIGSIILIVLIILTGSRTSLLLSALIILVFLPQTIQKVLQKKHQYSKRFSWFFVYFLGAFAMFFAFFFITQLSDILDSLGMHQLAERTLFFEKLSDSKGIGQDESLNYRLSILSRYWGYIYDNMLFGYGPQFARDKLENGTFQNVSQNEFIEVTLSYGAFYTIYYLLVFYKTYKSSKKGELKDFIFNPLKAFLVFLFFLAFSVNNLFWNRSLAITLGILMGLVTKTRIKKVISGIQAYKLGQAANYNSPPKG